MKTKLIQFGVALAFSLSTYEATAQLILPAPSPKASVMQTVGLTDITIDYSSPAVKGRVIWGELVPYDSLWRAGANQPVKITFSKDVTIDGKNVPKGTYSIMLTPSKANDWTFVISKNPNAYPWDYKKDEILLSVKAKPQTIAIRERLAYTITDFTNESALVSMEWEKVKVSFTVNLATEKQTLDNITATLGSTWSTYNRAARYQLDFKKDYDLGLKWVDQSIALQNKWFNNWTKAQLLAAKGNTQEALVYAKKAKELGDKEENKNDFFFKDEVEKAIKDWSVKK